MKTRKKLFFMTASILAVLILAAAVVLTGCDTDPESEDTPTTPEVKIVSYIRTWAIPEAMREGNNRFWTANMIRGQYLTDLIIAFATIQSNYSTISIPGVGTGVGQFNLWPEIAALRTSHPHLRIHLSIGGGGDPEITRRFSVMAADPVHRASFIQSVTMWLDQRNLDGIDLNWEFPVGSGGQRPEDRDNYIYLLQELRDAMDELGARRGRHYMLSTAIPATSWFLQRNRVIDSANIVCFLKIMTYDYYGDWSNRTGHHAGLFRNPIDTQGWSTEQGMLLYLAAGIPREQLMVGVGFYGWGWSDVPAGGNLDTPGLFQPAPPRSLHTGHITGGTSTTRTLAYTDLKEHILDNPDSGFTRFWDDVAKAPWLFNEGRDIFISYSDSEQIRLIAEYAREQNFGGVFIWEYADDLSSTLVKVLHEAMHQDMD